jgi:WD40 repeat protein
MRQAVNGLKLIQQGVLMLLYEDHKDDDPKSFPDHRGVVWALAFSPDGSSFVSGGKDGALYLRDSSGERQTIIERLPTSLPIHSAAFAEDGTLLVGGAFGWMGYRKKDASSWNVFGQLKTTPTNSLAMLDATTLVVGTGDRDKPFVGAFEMWDIRSGRRLEPRYPEPNGVRSVAVCPQRRMVAWLTLHRKIFYKEVIKQKQLEINEKKQCFAIAFNPDGSRLAVAVDYFVKVHSTEKQYVFFELKHTGTVRCVAFSPDGSTIATGSWDQTVKLWDAQTGKERATYKWPIGRVSSLAFAPDGFRLAAGGDQGSVVIWDLE